MLAREEEAHIKKVDIFLQLQIETGDAFQTLSEAEYLIRDYLMQLKMIQEQMLNHFDDLHPEDLLQAALEVENHLSESHERLLYHVSNPDLRELVENLNQGNETHVKQIRDFLKRLK